MKSFSLLTLSAIAVLSLNACTASGNLTITPPNPSAKPSTSPSAKPSVSPSATPTAEPSVGPSADPSSSPSTGGAITFIGGDVFNKYKVDFKPGMTWVYGMKSVIGNISFGTKQLPGGISLPGNISIPGFPTSGTGSSSSGMDLGDFTVKVVSVTDANVTFETSFNLSVGTSPAPSVRTVPRTNGWTSVFVESAAQGQKGIITFTDAGAESITVPAQTYSNAGKVSAKMQVTQTAGSATGAVDQDLTYWMANGVGMVKVESKASVSASGGSGTTANVNTTTVIELKSFIN